MQSIHLFKKYFIPGGYNDHKPHILRTEVTVFFLVVILLVEMMFLLQVAILNPNAVYFAEVLPTVIAGLTNDDRQMDDLPELQVNTTLQKAAQMKADDMAKNGYFAHNSPDGTTPWFWIDSAGYAYDYVGENLAINFFDSSDVNKAWMESINHRKNIMNAKFTEVGIATAKGSYEGRETIFIVQMFGRPKKNDVANSSVVKAGVLEDAKKDMVKPSTQKEIVEIVSKQENENAGEVSGAFVASVEPAHSIPSVASPKASVFGKITTMPRLMNAYLYGVLLTIFSLAMVLKIFIKIKIQHSQLIANGAMLLIIMATALVINQKIALAYANIL